MEKENKEEKVVKIKDEKIYKAKDIVFTAIIAFLIGAILTAGGFTIFNKSHRKGDIRNFKQDNIQRSIGPGEFNNNQGQENRQPNSKNNSNNSQTPPSMPNEPQNAPNTSNNQENQNQPNNAQQQPNMSSNSSNQNNV